MEACPQNYWGLIKKLQEMVKEQNNDVKIDKELRHHESNLVCKGMEIDQCAEGKMRQQQQAIVGNRLSNLEIPKVLVKLFVLDWAVTTDLTGLIKRKALQNYLVKDS